MIGARETFALLHLREVSARAFSFDAVDPSRAGATQCEASARLADRKTQAAELSPEFAVEVEEAEVQTSRHRDRHAGRRSCMQKVHCGRARPLFPSAPICACRNRVRVYNVFDQGLWQAPVACALAEVRPGSRRVAEKAPERTYSEEEIATRLQRDLPHWRYEGGWIRRKYKTHSWKGTLMVINAVGHLAEAAWHHPDITASYAWVEVRLMNHAAKGVTDKDFELAKKIEEVVQWRPGKAGGALEGTPETDQRFAYIKYD